MTYFWDTLSMDKRGEKSIPLTVFRHSIERTLVC